MQKKLENISLLGRERDTEYPWLTDFYTASCLVWIGYLWLTIFWVAI